MKKDMWCAFKSIGAVKIKQPKERALDRLLSTSSNENFLAFLQGLSVPVNHQTVKRYCIDSFFCCCEKGVLRSLQPDEAIFSLVWQIPL
jgi:hypothetical protein